MKKTIIIAVMAIIALFTISANTNAKAFDASDLTYLGPDAYIDDEGICHDGTGRCWGADGIVFYEDDCITIEESKVALAAAPDMIEDDMTDLGPAIYMDANGITHTSDGLAWGPDGIVYREFDLDESEIRTDLGPAIYLDGNGYFHTSDGKTWKAEPDELPEGFCYNHEAILGTPIWMDEAGNLHDAGRTVYVSISIDENGLVSTSVNGIIDLGDVDVICIVSYSIINNQILMSIQDAESCEEIVCIVIEIADACAGVVA